MNASCPFRIGHGWDSHKLAQGRKLNLCLVTVPYEKGLLGHSDADAPVHALIDAVFGALALGDIGRHFPDNDPAYEGISGAELLKKVFALPELSEWTIVNADVTIIAQKPKLSPYVDEMRMRLAEALSIDISSVSVKAKTAEGLGPVGAGDSIEAHAVVLLARKA